MKKIALLALVLAAFSALSGCNDEVELEGGLIPAKYNDIVEPLTGAYGGIMENGEPLSFEVIRDGQVVRAKLIDDFLGGDCESSLGTLRRVEIREPAPGKYEIERAVFSLNPNKCAGKVAGRELEVTRIDSGSGKIKFEAKVHAGNSRLYSCEPSPTIVGANAALRNPAIDCSWVNEKDYLRGELAKFVL